MVNDLFKQALKLMLEECNFVNVEMFDNAADRKAAKEDFEMLKDISSKCDLLEMPFVALLANIKSVSVLREVIREMVVIEQRLIKGEKQNV